MVVGLKGSTRFLNPGHAHWFNGQEGLSILGAAGDLENHPIDSEEYSVLLVLQYDLVHLQLSFRMLFQMLSIHL